MRNVTIYADGSCVYGEHNSGGYASLLFENGVTKTIYGNELNTNNSRMEIMAVTEALDSLDDKSRCNVTIYSDYKYLIDAINDRRLEAWQANGWRNKKGKRVKNYDLLGRLLYLKKKHNCQFFWIKSHTGNSNHNICDKISKEMAYKRISDLE